MSNSKKKTPLKKVIQKSKVRPKKKTPLNEGKKGKPAPKK